MTERSNTAIETAEAIISLLEEYSENAEGDGTYETALRDVRTFAASLRLHQPPPRRQSRAKGE